MKFVFVALVAHALLMCCMAAHIDGVPMEWEEAPIEVEVGPIDLDFNRSSIVPFSACNLQISNDVGQPSPVMVTPGTVNTVRGSNGNGLLVFNAGQGIRLACPGNGNFLRVAGNPQEANAQCVGGTTFSVNGVQVQFSQLSCNRWPEHVNYADGTCSRGALVKTGFRIQAGFVDLYDACHDTQQHHTFWTKFVLGRDVAGFQRGVDRPDWRQGSFFQGLNADNLYRRATQRDTLTVLLGSRSLAEHYIHMSNDYFMSKGHLVAKADFLHGAHQMTTFWYTNAAPQWQTFNGNNWNTLEDNVRTFAARTNRDLDVYTGTFGRADLPNVNGQSVDLYLTTSRQMPTPRMFWKIIYDPITRLGTAFIGLNNPYQSAASAARDVRCQDISHTISWLTWQRTDLVRGYSYTCDVNDFRNNFPDIPYLQVTGVLR